MQPFSGKGPKGESVPVAVTGGGRVKLDPAALAALWILAVEGGVALGLLAWAFLWRQ